MVERFYYKGLDKSDIIEGRRAKCQGKISMSLDNITVA